jgi:hypothetical protein
MTTINEVPRVHKWLYTVMAADGTLNTAVGGRIFEGHVPQGESFPAVVYSLATAGDDLFSRSGPFRVWAKFNVTVKVVNETNSTLSLQSIADRFEAILESATGGVTGLYIDYCKRKRPFHMKDTSVANKVYTHLGGVFELACRIQE